MEPFIGQICLFGYPFAPRGWADCDGQLLAIAQNTALFSLLGTTYGGDGRTTFGLPDLRGRVPIHVGHGNGLEGRKLGQAFGNSTTVLTPAQLPAHHHGLDGGGVAVPVSTNSPDRAGGRGAILANGQFYSDTPNANYTGAPLPLRGNTADAGEGAPIDNHPPALTVRYCIALVGTFPSRS